MHPTFEQSLCVTCWFSFQTYSSSPLLLPSPSIPWLIPDSSSWISLFPPLIILFSHQCQTHHIPCSPPKLYSLMCSSLIARRPNNPPSKAQCHPTMDLSISDNQHQSMPINSGTYRRWEHAMMAKAHAFLSFHSFTLTNLSLRWQGECLCPWK